MYSVSPLPFTVLKNDVLIGSTWKTWKCNIWTLTFPWWCCALCSHWQEIKSTGYVLTGPLKPLLVVACTWMTGLVGWTGIFCSSTVDRATLSSSCWLFLGGSTPSVVNSTSMSSLGGGLVLLQLLVLLVTKKVLMSLRGDSTISGCGGWSCSAATNWCFFSALFSISSVFISRGGGGSASGMSKSVSSNVSSNSTSTWSSEPPNTDVVGDEFFFSKRWWVSVSERWL